MAAINFPTATSNGQTFTADTGVIYTYIGTPPNGFWSGTFGTTGLATLDGRFVALNDGNSIQTMQTQGLKFNNGTADTILLDGVNSKVGIGTTSPGRHLHINGGSETVKIQITNTTTGSSNDGEGFQIGIAANGTANIEQRENADLVFATNNTEAMRIDNSRNVLVGKTSSTGLSAGCELRPAGFGVFTRASANPLQIRRLTDDGDLVEFYQDSGLIGSIGVQGTSLTVGMAGGERMRIDSSGRLLLGTTNEGHADADNLTIADTLKTGITVRNTNVAGDGAIFFSDDGTGTGEYSGFIEYGHSGDYMRFATASTERMRIDSSGKVGIGCTPVRDLQLHASDASSELMISNSTTGATAGSGFMIQQDGNDNYIWNKENSFMSFGTNALERMRIDSSGRVGIGTTPSSGTNQYGDRLVVSNTTVNNGNTGVTIRGANSGSSFASLYFTDPGTTNRGWIEQQLGGGSSSQLTIGTSGLIRFYAGGGEKARIDSAGNVGIGDSAPNTNLVVKGASNSLTNSVGNINVISTDSAAINAGGSIGLGGFYNGTSSSIPFANLHGKKENGTGNNAAGYFAISTRNASSGTAERMRIESDGTMLITSGSANKGIDLLANGSRVARFAVSNPGVDHTPYIGSVLGNDFYIMTNNTQRLRISSTGHVHVENGALFVQTSATGFTPSDGLALITDGNSDKYVWNYENTSLRFGTNNTERMRIHTTGCVGINDDTTAFAEALQVTSNHSSGAYSIACKIVGSGGYLMRFASSNGVIGSITCSGSSTAFNTSSDYRLKENVVNLSAAIPRLKTLPVYRFNFITDSEKIVDGFLAHEAQLVVPEAVTGTHNEVDGDGNPVMQSIDQAKLVPLLTAALQEAIGRIETLETEVAALKAG